MSAFTPSLEKTQVLKLLEGSKLFTVAQKKFLDLAWDKLPEANQEELFRLLEKEKNYAKTHNQDVEKKYTQLFKNALARLEAVKRGVQRRLIIDSEAQQDLEKNPEEDLLQALKNL